MRGLTRAFALLKLGARNSAAKICWCRVWIGRDLGRPRAPDASSTLMTSMVLLISAISSNFVASSDTEASSTFMTSMISVISVVLDFLALSNTESSNNESSNSILVDFRGLDFSGFVDLRGRINLCGFSQLYDFF
ncbi:hypothetical protein PG995_005036 [Apiospora arundinis]